MKKRNDHFVTFLIAALALILCGHADASLIWPGEKTLEYAFSDGVKIKVHYMDASFKTPSQAPVFARDVLNASVSAYQTISQFQGFSSNGFGFASSDHSYAYDPDKTIDIYLGHSSQANPFEGQKAGKISFKDAPCFDTVAGAGKNAFDAVILLPSNYSDFIKSWEKMNPSTLGKRNVEVDLQGTLIHEMLHTIIFYYNKNMNKEAQGSQDTANVSKVDWYVEGLARYFETLVGAKHDFYSQGFKQILVDKVRFSRGGANYFMRFPDQSFTDLRYENALFWRYFDQRFGMAAIEAMSRSLRELADQTPAAALEKASGVSMEKMLKEYALTVLFKDFGLKEHTRDLKDVARTSLVWRPDGFYLAAGAEGEEFLGPVCRTDWVGQWGDIAAGQAGLPVAGDNTREADISGWATDFIEITPEKEAGAELGVNVLACGKPLLIQVVFVTRGGSHWTKKLSPAESGDSRTINIREILSKENVAAEDLSKIFFVLTNSDPTETCRYELTAR